MYISQLEGETSKHWDRNGLPMSFERHALCYENLAYRTVEQTMVGDYLVSTIWEGAPSLWVDMFQKLHPDREIVPDIYETRVMNEPRRQRQRAEMHSTLDFPEWTPEEQADEIDGLSWRWCTEEAARKGHAAAVEHVRQLLQPDLRPEDTTAPPTTGPSEA